MYDLRWTMSTFEKLRSLREDYDWLETGSTLLVDTGDQNMCWCAFAGQAFNVAAGAAMTGVAARIRANDLSVDFERVTKPDALKSAIEARVLVAAAEVTVPLDSHFVVELKFHQCVPAEVATEVLARRFCVERERAAVAALPLKTIKLNLG